MVHASNFYNTTCNIHIHDIVYLMSQRLFRGSIQRFRAHDKSELAALAKQVICNGVDAL